MICPTPNPFADAGRSSRRRLALISYNNKEVGDAIPLYEQVVAPLASEAMGDDSASGPLLRRAFGAARGVASLALDAFEDDVLDIGSRLDSTAPLLGALNKLVRREVSTSANAQRLNVRVFDRGYSSHGVWRDTGVRLVPGLSRER